MGSKKNNTKLSDLKFGQDLQNLNDTDLSKFKGGKIKKQIKWNGCGDFVPL